MNKVFANLPVTIFEAMSQLARDNNAINLGQGFPNFDGPNFIKDAAIEAIRAGHGQYARMFGIPALNSAIADRFAADSGSQVGAIRSANQGVFSISAANQGSQTSDEAGFNADQQADSSIMKKVRVVSTIDYYLVN